MVGEGVIVTLSDNDVSEIDIYDILQLLNELKLAGAEAISINEIRVVNTTDVALINNSYIKMDDHRLNSPYVVKAIGDPVKLESGLMQKESGYMDKIIKAMDKTATVERSNNIVIPKYDGKMTIKYIEMEEQG